MTPSPNSSPAGRQTTLLIVAVTVIVLSGLWLWRWYVNQNAYARLDTKRYRQIGVLMGEELARRLDQGTAIVLLRKATERDALYRATIENGLLTAVRPAQITVLATEAVATDPADTKLAPLLDRDGYAVLAQKYPAAKAFVFINGLPFLSYDFAHLDKYIGEWPVPTTPLILIAVDYEHGAKPFLDRGVTPWAIVNRYEPGGPAGTPTTPREFYERNYQIVTATAP